MASRPDTSLPVDARGCLRIEAPSGRSLDLIAEGRMLRLTLPGRADLRSLIPRSFRTRSRIVRRLAGALSDCGLTLSLEAAGRPVIQMGAKARPTWLARLLGLAPARVRLSALILLTRG